MAGVNPYVAASGALAAWYKNKPQAVKEAEMVVAAKQKAAAKSAAKAKKKPTTTTPAPTPTTTPTQKSGTPVKPPTNKPMPTPPVKKNKNARRKNSYGKKR